MRLLIFLFLITAMIMGCSKKFVEKPHTDTDSDENTWRLLNSSGGFAGTSTGYGDKMITLSLLRDSTYIQKINGVLINSGTYSRQIDVQPNGNDTILVFQYHGVALSRYVYMNDNKMVLWDGFMDGYYHTYAKVGN